MCFNAFPNIEPAWLLVKPGEAKNENFDQYLKKILSIKYINKNYRLYCVLKSTFFKYTDVNFKNIVFVL